MKDVWVAREGLTSEQVKDLFDTFVSKGCKVPKHYEGAGHNHWVNNFHGWDSVGVVDNTLIMGSGHYDTTPYAEVMAYLKGETPPSEVSSPEVSHLSELQTICKVNNISIGVDSEKFEVFTQYDEMYKCNTPSEVIELVELLAKLSTFEKEC